MSQIEAILFDSDGVLAHTESLIFKLNQEVLKTHGIEYTRDDFIEHTFLTNMGSAGWLQKKGYDAPFAKVFAEERNRRWRVALQSQELIDASAFPVLSILKEKYKLCIVTNTERDMFERIYRNGAVIDLLDATISREDYKEAKPSPDAYLTALGRLNVSPDRALVVEDSPRGIEAARSAGLRVVGIVNPEFDGLDLSRATYHIQTLKELPALLRDL